MKFTNRANYVYLLNYGKFDTRYMSLHCLSSYRISSTLLSSSTWNTLRTKHEHFEHVPKSWYQIFDARSERKVIQPQPLLLRKTFPSSQRNAFGQCCGGRKVQMNLWIWWQRGWSDLKFMCLCVCVWVFVLEYLSGVNANWRPKSDSMLCGKTKLKLHKRNSFTLEFSSCSRSSDNVCAVLLLVM